ncbi:MAG TPA: aspartyl protease family protein [Vicinamibacterales bacterium]|nr:aspartyl protease family protein [Vicinamibacterales bacterium]
MRSGFRTSVVLILIAAASLVIHADGTPPSQAADVQLQLGGMLFAEGRYIESLEAYQNAVKTTDTSLQRSARAGLIVSALRVAEFDLARHEAETLVRIAPRDAGALALYGDALWASGLFEEAEARYRDALSLEPNLARGLHGMARSQLARNQHDEALNEAQAALRLAPRDLEIHHTVGSIYERMHKYEEAAAAYGNYVNLLPNKDTSEKAAWSRAEIRFLRSFAQRVPFQADPGSDDMVYTVDFRTLNDKIVVRARVNDSTAQDFVVDTGAENTVITEVTARRLGVAPITYTLSAGVGETGLRGLQLARVDSLELGTLKLRNVPVIIKSPPLRDLPTNETESLSPLSLGYSMIIDYGTHKLTFGKHLPAEPGGIELPLRVYRLATVRGVVGKDQDASFVVDTGGEVISISQATADRLPMREGMRKIQLKVYGSSGWDRDAFLMPGMDLSFDEIKYTNFPVVVLNLRAPSELLGFQLGGIVGHKFLSGYRVGIDLERSVLRLKSLT